MYLKFGVDTMLGMKLIQLGMYVTVLQSLPARIPLSSTNPVL